MCTSSFQQSWWVPSLEGAGGGCCKERAGLTGAAAPPPRPAFFLLKSRAELAHKRVMKRVKEWWANESWCKKQEEERQFRELVVAASLVAARCSIQSRLSPVRAEECGISHLIFCLFNRRPDIIINHHRKTKRIFEIASGPP